MEGVSHEVGDRDGTGGRRRVMPYQGREHRRGGGAQHVASAGKLGPLAGPGCGAPAGVSEHPQRPRLLAWGPRACSRPAPTSSPVAGSAQPRRPPAPQPPETRLPAPGAPAAGATAGAGAGATPPPEGADERTSPARAAEPLPGRCPAHAAGPERERSWSPAGADAALRGAGRTTTPTMPRAPGRGRRAVAGWDRDPSADPRW